MNASLAVPRVITSLLSLPYRRILENRRVLIVDDDEPALRRLPPQLRDAGLTAIDTTSSWSEARALLPKGYALLLVEAKFADGSDCRALIEAAHRLRYPPDVIVMSARASRELIAELMFAGASGYLEKPLSMAALETQLGRLDELGRCRRAARILVGRVGLKEAQWYVRGVMSREALSRADGSQRGAASILGVDRRYVARLIDEFQDERFAPRPHFRDEDAPGRE